jgi:hypothetical protein
MTMAEKSYFSVSGSIALFIFLRFVWPGEDLGRADQIAQSATFFALSLAMTGFTWASIINLYSLTDAAPDLREELAMPAREYLEMVVLSVFLQAAYSMPAFLIFAVVVKYAAGWVGYSWWKVDVGLWFFAFQMALVLISRLGLFEVLKERR